MSHVHGNRKNPKGVTWTLLVATGLICIVALIIGLSGIISSYIGSSADEVPLKNPEKKSQPPQAVELLAPVGDSPYLGNENAKLTIFVFSDYECPYCAKAHRDLKALLKSFPHAIRLVYKFMPLIQMHHRVYYAAQAALAAHEQGMFWEYSDKLYKNAPDFTDEDFLRYAVEINLDLERFNESYTSGKFATRVDEDLELAKSTMDNMAAPTLFINDKVFKGVPKNLDVFVVEELKRVY